MEAAMTEVHVVRHANAHLYCTELDDYFRARHNVYVKERAWKELDRPDGQDIDQFDTAAAIHLLAIDRSCVVGGHRFNPTTGPTLLSTVFPQLAARALVADSEVYETTRLFVVKERRGEQAQPRIESLLFAATLEFALSEELRQIRFLMETWWFPRLQDMGWSVRPLGVPTDIKGMNCIAVSLDITEEVWAETCLRRAVPGPVLVWNGIHRPSYQFPSHLRFVA
jgi:acyl-homoserine lactone synthase